MDHDRTLNGSEKLALKDWLITRAQNYASSLKPLADAVPLNIDNIDFSAVLGKVKPTGYETLIGPSLLSYSDSRASILNQYNDGVQSFVSRQAMMSAGRTTIAVESTSEMQQQNRFRAMARDMNANYISGLGLTFGQQMYFNARNNGGNEQQVNNAYLRGTIIDASFGIAGGAASAGASASYIRGIRPNAGSSLFAQSANVGRRYTTGPSSPYSNPKNRPSYAAGQEQTVWNSGKNLNGRVFDPNSPIELKWDPSRGRNGQWDMGHKFGHDYKGLHREYMGGDISLKDFLSEYRNPQNYHPEYPSSNRSRVHDKK